MEGFGIITREELKSKIDGSEDFTLLEILGENAYRKAHLPGAIRMQDLDLIPELLPDKSAEVVTYCSSPT
jgi:rhodanese-related sulfurtransferase